MIASLRPLLTSAWSYRENVHTFCTPKEAVHNFFAYANYPYQRIENIALNHSRNPGEWSKRETAMKRDRFFRLKNGMLIANGISNAIGLGVILLYSATIDLQISPEINAVTWKLNLIFNPLAFLFAIVITVRYEKPVRRYLNYKRAGNALTEELTLEARRRVLNEPFFLITLDFFIWCAAAVIYCLAFWTIDKNSIAIPITFLRSLLTGMITATVAFFVLERHLQQLLIPYFFPEGGLYMTTRTIRIRIRTRLSALIFAANFVPFMAVLFTLHTYSHMDFLEPVEIFNQLRTNLFVDSLVFMGVAFWLTFLVSTNLTQPLQNIVRVLREVRNGNFDCKVSVTSNDEIGYTGDVINEMTDGLKERDYIKDIFGKYVAREVRDEILSGRVPLDGEMKEVTVLFADLRNFTPFVDSTPPKEVVRIINGYFKEMAEAIAQSKGLVLQYIGDEIEAVFGAPLPIENHASMAVQAALEMRKRLHMVNQDLESRGYAPLAHGIGIHTGQVLAANIGSPDRLSYTMIGDTVNLASRLQGLNKEFDTDIIISRSTHNQLYQAFPFKELPPARVKGKSQSVQIFTLM